MKNLSIDLETYSSEDLTKCGVYKYSEAPDFEVLLFGYSYDGGDVQVIDLACGEHLPDVIKNALTDETITKWAFNAQFERVCLSRYLGVWLNPNSWRCTMVWSAYMGLPLSLEGSGAVLGLSKQKQKEGKDLIRYFSIPRRCSNTDESRMRNFPSDAPDKWALFKVYNARDVETELEIQTRLQKYPVPEDEWQNYILDQQINDRGILLDMDLVCEAMRFDKRAKVELTTVLQNITELDNPNSVTQLKAWFSEQGLEIESLGKATVKELLKTAPEELVQVLEMRQSLAKSSVKKYAAMACTVCKDGRARGLIQFYGANRTGRFAGRLIQVQNLPQNHMSDLAQARKMVKNGGFDVLEILYDSVPAVLSELIRTAFIPKLGYQFIVADFSAIEARVIAWLAGETWRNEVFATHGKIYEASASQMFHVPNERTAMQTTAVYACVRILAEAIAGLPLHIYRYKEDGGKERVIDHSLYYLLHDEPNPEMTSFVFRETLMSHLLLWGNAYAQIVRDGRGRVLALYPLLPSKMEVSRSVSGELLYTYRRDTEESRVNPSSGTVTLQRDEVLHIPGLGFDGIVGYSPIAMAKNAIGMSLATEEYGASFFANGANPGGVLEHPGVIKDIQRVKDSWNSAYQGTGNAHRVAVLEEGMKFQAIGIPPEQAQFLETRKFQINEIARIFRVPPHMVGDLEKSSFSNIEQQSLEFVKYTLDPWVVRWEQSIQQSLILPSEKSSLFVKFNLDGLLRGDYQSRMSGYATARQNGWMSANDIRELEDMNQISAEEGGDLYLVNGNMTKLSDAGAFAKNQSKEVSK